MTDSEQTLNSGETGKTYDTVEKKKDNDQKDAPQSGKEEEKIPEYGGAKRLQAEFGAKFKCLTFFGFLFAIANGCMMPVFAILFREVLAIIGAGAKNNKENIRVMLYFIGMGVIMCFLTIVQYYIWGRYGILVGVNVREQYFQAMLAQDIGYHDQKTSGLINSELMSDASAIEEGVGQKMGVLWQQFGTFAFGMGLSFYYSWRMTLTLMATLPVLILIGVMQGKMLNRISKGRSDPFSQSTGFSQEILTNVKIVKAYPSLLKKKYREFVAFVEEAGPINTKREVALGMGIGAMFFGTIGVMYSVGMYTGARYVHDGHVESANMFGSFMAFMIAGMGIGQLGSVMGDINKAGIASNKFYHVVERKPEIRGPDGPPISKEVAIRGEIEFKDVCFSYPSSPDEVVLDEVSFKIKAGDTLAIVGPSGSGKSTIVNLLERYYDPTSGVILIDGQPIHNYDMSALRSKIGLVSQMPLLFDASIRENIRGGYSKEEVSDEAVEEVAKLANAHEFITSFSNGYEQPVGELGGRMSGGQKQRLVIARALLSDPSILLLDEATSALDSKNEKEVQAAIDRVNQVRAKTTIAIAHRLSTIKDFKHILVLVDGCVTEQGTHDELMSLDSVYAALIRAQQLTAQKEEAEQKSS